MFKVTATAPTRVDLAGGTLDLWPIHNLLTHKATINVAISLNATVTVESSPDKLFHLKSLDQKTSDSGSFQDVCKSKTLGLLGLLLSAAWREDLPPVTISTSALSPAGAGLGGSSCLAVTTLKALFKAREACEKGFQDPSEEQLVRTAQDVESLVIHAPTGVQDYWGAVRGGINILSYPFGSIEVETFPSTVWHDDDFKLICCYSGKSRASAINNWEIFKRIFDGDKDLLKKMEEIGSEAFECATAFRQKRWQEVIRASEREWKLRCKLWPAIETVETRAIDEAARSAGAYFSRVCGAGGGGVMAIFAPTPKAAEVCSQITRVGGQVLDVVVGAPGLKVTSTT